MLLLSGCLTDQLKSTRRTRRQTFKATVNTSKPFKKLLLCPHLCLRQKGKEGEELGKTIF
jgi:hypothetical protein